MICLVNPRRCSRVRLIFLWRVQLGPRTDVMLSANKKTKVVVWPFLQADELRVFRSVFAEIHFMLVFSDTRFPPDFTEFSPSG
ncbi:hypothetical protein [Phaffia rhodozyma]|uniref:Uncharacterized protein n=1 Tax=Phaffia rhodozyma TaxID=264483 RepID=A0A0F7SGY0_PHARH|nr:hypothetical protein [Phaffia rhodozyma]